MFTTVKEIRKREDGTLIETSRKNLPIWVTIWVLMFGTMVYFEMIDIKVKVEATIKPPSVSEIIK